MPLKRILNLTLAVFVFMAFGVAAAQADTIYISIKGIRQGQFKGEVLQKGFEGKIAGLKFRYDVVSPRDLATGQASGKRQHKPVIISKEWGAASPQLFQSLVTNEVLAEVVIDFVGVDSKSGAMALSHTIKLTNASIAEISQSTESTSTSTGGIRHLEDVSFTFQKIELIDTRSNTMAMDSWLAPIQ